jgi:hypothetical protein
MSVPGCRADKIRAITDIGQQMSLPPTEALLMFSSRLESTARQFSQSEYQSIRDKSQGMKLLAEEVRQEIDKRISI